jgi:hypothetical protein
MLDRLPPELLAEILDFIALFSPVRASETLFACCLASRAIRDVAEPILWKRVKLDCDTAATSLVEALRRGHDGTQTRELEMKFYRWDRDQVKAPSLVSSVIEASPLLTKVSFRGGRRTVSAEEASALASLACEHSSPHLRGPGRVLIFCLVQRCEKSVFARFDSTASSSVLIRLLPSSPSSLSSTAPSLRASSSHCSRQARRRISGFCTSSASVNPSPTSSTLHPFQRSSSLALRECTYK